MKCLFRHKYTPIVAQQAHRMTDGGQVTIVTLRCQRCGKLKQQELTGRLTLEDITGMEKSNE